MEYRFKEKDGEFTIQIRAYTIEGYFWWRKKTLEWHKTNLWGGVRGYYGQRRFEPPSPTFRSLEEAKQQIEEWNKPPSKAKYHY